MYLGEKVDLTYMNNCDRILEGEEKDMKKIYTFTLDGEDSPSEKFRYNLRLFAYLLYDYLYNYDGDGVTPLNINEKIVCNKIYDGKCSNEYYLDSDLYDDGYINYEPFLIGNYSFGLTVVDETINEEILYDLINQVLFMIKLNCKIRINSVSYEAKDINDESQRRKALFMAYSNLGCQLPSKKITPGFSRKKILKRGYGQNFVRAIGR